MPSDSNGNKWTTGAASTADGRGGEMGSTESVVRAGVSMGSATCTAGTKAIDDMISRLSAGHPIDGRVPVRYPEHHTLSSRVPDRGPDLLFG